MIRRHPSSTRPSKLFPDTTLFRSFMVQQFLPSVSQGDKRIVLVDGEVAGAINRKPGEGEFRSNLAVGGYAEAAELTPRGQEIRSEEHTSELQSLMRISYAVFCLKKKTKQKITKVIAS